MAPQPSQCAATGILEIFSDIHLIRRALFIIGVAQCRRPELNSQVLFIIRIDFNNLRFQTYLGRMGENHKVHHIASVFPGFPGASCIELRNLYGCVMVILIFHLAANEHFAVHHLHLNARHTDGFLNRLSLPLILAGYIDTVFFPDAISRPYDEGCGTRLFPYQKEIMVGQQIDICNFRIPHSDAGNLWCGHIFRTVKRYRNRNRSQYAFSSQQQRCTYQEAYSFNLLIHY